MKTLRASLGGLALAAAAAGCAVAPLPGYLLDPEGSPPPACPPDRFVAAVGSSTAGRAEAEQRARAAVVKKLGSSIAVETKRVVEVSRKSGIFTSDRSLTERIEERAEFRRGDLVRTVGAPVERRGETYALACLDRAAAAAALERDLAPALSRYRAASRRAREALRAEDSAGFAAAYREASRGALEALAGLAQLRAVSGAGPEPDLERDWGALLDAAARRRESASFRIEVTGAVPEDVRSAIASAFRASVAGWGTGPVAASGCAGAGRTAYLVRVHAEPGCAWGSLGYACRPRLALRAERCGTGRVVLEASLHEPQLSGIDPDRPERALRKAVRGLTPAALEPALREAFSGELPL